MRKEQALVGGVIAMAAAVAACGGGPIGVPIDEQSSVGTQGAAAEGPASPSAIPGGATVIAFEAGSDPSGIAVDATDVYWMDMDGCVDASNVGRIMKAPIAGGSSTTLATGQYLCAGDIDEITAITLDATSVYWTSMGHGTVMRINKDGSDLRTLAKNQTPSSIAVDDEFVYWTNQNDAPDGSVMKCPKAGGVSQTLASGFDNPVGLVLDAAQLYWVGPFDGSVNRVGVDGSSPTVLTMSQGGASYLAVASGSIYWTTGSGLVMKMAESGGNDSVLLASNQDSPMGIAADTGNAYWTIDDNQGSVLSISVNGGGTVVPVAVPSQRVACSGLAIDSTNVYFTCSDGSVLKHAKTGS